MRFSLDVLRAHKGDCLMLHFGAEDDPHMILIDGGPSDVYRPQLKHRINRIRKARELEQKDPLPIDVVLVSHTDDDHIRGILELTADQLSNNPDPPLWVSSLWHNTFDDLLNSRPEELLSGFGQASFAASANRNDLFEGIEFEEADDQNKKQMHQVLDMLASIPQGRQLRDDREALEAKRQRREWRLNHKFGGKLILAKAGAQPVEIGGLKITVAGPMHAELEALQKAHDKWVKKHMDEFKKNPEAMLAAFVDKSVPNLSSIVLFVEAGVEAEAKSILLTGDARGDKILEGLELSGVLPPGKERPINILKVPHHGSDNNMEPVFFKRLPADHYVFSGDGKHGNPERATLQMLLDARGAEAPYTIHLTYQIADIDRAREEDWNKEKAKEGARKKKNKNAKEPREAWSAAKHSLQAFFDKNPKMKAKLSLVEDQTPHVINLLEPVRL
jgi:hypothetical protein